jgi:hypothetical protein
VTDTPVQPPVVAIFGDANKTRRILLMVIKGQVLPPAIDDKFVVGFDGGIEKSTGDKRIWGMFIPLAGLQAYERFGSFTVKGKTVSTLSEAVIASGTFYQVEALRFDGAADQDPDIQKCLVSFHFLSPPPMPSPVAATDTAAFQLGQTIGRWMVFGMMGFGGVVAVVIIILDRARRGRLPPPRGR